MILYFNLFTPIAHYKQNKRKLNSFDERSHTSNFHIWLSYPYKETSLSIFSVKSVEKETLKFYPENPN